MKLWWGLMIGVVALSAFSRYEARSAYAAREEGPRLIDAARLILPEQGYRVTGDVESRVRGEGSVGLRFESGACAGSMSVLEFPITIVAATFVEDHLTEGDSHRYHYHDYAYTGSTRPTLTMLWAKAMIRNGLTPGAQATTKRQIAVIWPRTCTEPPIDWSGLWAS